MLIGYHGINIDYIMRGDGIYDRDLSAGTVGGV